MTDPVSDPEVIIEKIRVAVNQLDGLDFAFIFGSWAARYHDVDGPPPNDIDVLLIGDISRGEKSRLYGELNREVGGIEVNPYAITLAMWEADAPDIFVRDVRDASLIPLLTDFELAYRDSEARRIVEESRSSGTRTRTTWKPGPPA